MSAVTVGLASVPNLPAGTVCGGYLVALSGATVGAIPTFLIPYQSTGASVSATVPTALLSDTYSGTVTNVAADGATPIPGVPVVSIPPVAVSGTVTLNLAAASATLTP